MRRFTPNKRKSGNGGHFAQLFGDAKVVAAIARHQRGGWNLHVLVMIHGKIAAIARARAERRHGEHVGEEFEAAPVPGENHRARAGQTRRFFIGYALPGGHGSHVLDHAVRPGDADGIGLPAIGEAEVQRHSLIDLFLIKRAGLHFDFGARRQLEILHAFERNLYPVMRSGGLVVEQVNTAIGSDRGETRPS
jgi:hypothetical protein